MVKKNISQEGLKKIDNARNDFIKEIKENELMSKKHKTVYSILNYIAQFRVLASTITGCVSISAFPLLKKSKLNSLEVLIFNGLIDLLVMMNLF